MSVTKLKDLSVVRLNDGRRGTVVHVYESGEGARLNAALVELSDANESYPENCVNVLPKDVAEVVWEPKD